LGPHPPWRSTKFIVTPGQRVSPAPPKSSVLLSGRAFFLLLSVTSNFVVIVHFFSLFSSPFLLRNSSHLAELPHDYALGLFFFFFGVFLRLGNLSLLICARTSGFSFSLFLLFFFLFLCFKVFAPFNYSLRSYVRVSWFLSPGLLSFSLVDETSMTVVSGRAGDPTHLLFVRLSLFFGW